MTQVKADTVATAIAALYRYRDDYFEWQPEYKDATTAIADLEAQQADSAAVGEWTSEEAEEWRIEAVHFRDKCIEYEHRIRELEQAAAQAVAMPVEAPEALRYILMRYSQEHSGEDHQRRVREAKDWLLNQRRPGSSV